MHYRERSALRLPRLRARLCCKKGPAPATCAPLPPYVHVLWDLTDMSALLMTEECQSDAGREAS